MHLSYSLKQPSEITPVVTGLGVVSAFGIGAPAFFKGLVHGQSAISPIQSFDVSTFPVRVGGEVSAKHLTPFLRHENTSLYHTQIDISKLGPFITQLPERLPLLEHYNTIGAFRDRKVIFSLLAAVEAWNTAQCTEQEQNAALSIALGLEHAFLEDFASFFSENRIHWSTEPQHPIPSIRIRSHVGLSADILQRLFHLQGPTFVHASACAAGSLAIAQAASLIRRGTTSIVLCGGSDSMLNPLGLGGMSRLGAPSPRNESDACRPFDRRRDGLVMGEGAAMFVVESEEHALKRGVKPLAKILGWGSTQDAYRATAPRPDGSSARQAMTHALNRACLKPEAIGYINAHGTGTPLNDPAEAKAIRDTFGAYTDRLPVSSIKGAIGHLMAASGAIELAACLLPFQQHILPGTAHHQEKDPLCNIDVIGETPLKAEVNAVLSNSFGFGGQNASLILGRYP